MLALPAICGGKGAVAATRECSAQGCLRDWWRAMLLCSKTNCSSKDIPSLSVGAAGRNKPGWQQSERDKLRAGFLEGER